MLLHHQHSVKPLGQKFVIGKNAVRPCGQDIWNQVNPIIRFEGGTELNPISLSFERTPRDCHPRIGQLRSRNDRRWFYNIAKSNEIAPALFEV